MKTTLKFTITVCLCLSIQKASAQNIKDLDFLIGTWEVEETIYPGTDKEYKEKGIRTCSYFLNDAFIKCEAITIVSTSGKERHYGYYITWNHMDGFFQAVSLAHDFPRPGIHQWYLDKEKKIITFVTPKNVLGDRFIRGTISYENPKQLIWQGWWSKYNEDKDWEQIFRDVATRRE